jgi:hypothetical protein
VVNSTQAGRIGRIDRQRTFWFQDPQAALLGEDRMADTRWRKTLRGIAVEEMLHLALVSNLMTAIGAAPVFGRPNFPQRTRYFPPGTLGFRHRALGGGAGVDT